mgnify:CR=1 FL=1
MFSRKIVASAAALTIGATGLVACSNDGEGEPTSTEVVSETTTVEGDAAESAATDAEESATEGAGEPADETVTETNIVDEITETLAPEGAEAEATN